MDSVIDLLKLDCEGAEYAILMGASTESLARVQRIVMEYHDLDAEREHSLGAFLGRKRFQRAVTCQPGTCRDWLPLRLEEVSAALWQF